MQGAWTDYKTSSGWYRPGQARGIRAHIVVCGLVHKCQSHTTARQAKLFQLHAHAGQAAQATIPIAESQD